jgi:DNA-directed RNA polymerase alpha subunit
MSLEAVAKQIDVTRERVRQIEAKIFHKIRSRVTLGMQAIKTREKVDALERHYNNIKNETERIEKRTREFHHALAHFLDRQVAGKIVPVKEAYLSTRLYNILINEGKETLNELCNLTEREFLRFRYAGRKSLYELKAVMKENNLSLKYTT